VIPLVNADDIKIAPGEKLSLISSLPKYGIILVANGGYLQGK